MKQIVFNDDENQQSVNKPRKVYPKSLEAEMIKPDMVNHPPHYNFGGLEVIDVIKAFTSDLKGIEATDTGNVIKYILRWNHKNGLEDLKKAQWYLGHLINEVESKTKGEENESIDE